MKVDEYLHHKNHNIKPDAESFGSKIYIKKAGRYRINGQQFIGSSDSNTNEIIIDPRQNGKEFLQTAIHEKLHLIHPEYSETKIRIEARKLGHLIWSLGYRKVNLK
ncbi:MAG: hypothetical protein WCP61_08905 [Chitinophagia bacterium]|jgi:hypothetical protein